MSSLHMTLGGPETQLVFMLIIIIAVSFSCDLQIIAGLQSREKTYLFYLSNLFHDNLMPRIKEFITSLLE